MQSPNTLWRPIVRTSCRDCWILVGISIYATGIRIHRLYGDLNPYIFTVQREKLTGFSRVTRNEGIVQWYLSHGADPNAKGENGSTPMTFAAREASLSTLKLLVESGGGQVKGTDLIAQAAVGHTWGRPERIQVMEYLLDLGAPIDTMSASTWADPSSFVAGFTLEQYMLVNAGGQTALNVAQISGDMVLAEFLLSKGANPAIEPLNKEPVEEFQYMGEYYP